VHIYIYIYIYSGPSKVEHNLFQEAVRLSVCSTFSLFDFWVKWVWAARCCAMPHSWFDFRIFIRVSNRIFLEFFVRVSCCLRIKPFDFQGSTVYVKWHDKSFQADVRCIYPPDLPSIIIPIISIISIWLPYKHDNIYVELLGTHHPVLHMHMNLCSSFFVLL
jgi:hypothetical protein